MKKLILISALFSQSLQAMTGLHNIGNSCFMNASLQCLSALEALNYYLITHKGLYKQNSLTDQYALFVDNQLQDVPGFIAQGWTIMKKEPKTAQDSQEYVLHFLEHITEKDVLQDKSSSVADLFSVKAGSCICYEPTRFSSEPNITKELSLDLSVAQSDIHVQQVLYNHFKEEEVEFTLPREKKQVNATKQNFLDHTSKYLIINLKRKKADGQRCESAIGFPVENLDLSEFYANPFRKSGSYNLKGAIFHEGDGEGGHYTALIKREGQWYYCDDSTIVSKSPQEVATIANQGHIQSKQIVSTLIYERSKEPYLLLNVDPWAHQAQIKKSYEESIEYINILSLNENDEKSCIDALENSLLQLYCSHE